MQAVARGHGIDIDERAAQRVAVGAAAVLVPFGLLVARLAADDEPGLFRRLLELEAGA